MSFGKVPIFASYCRRGADSGNYRPIKPPPTSGVAAPIRFPSSATAWPTPFLPRHPPPTQTSLILRYFRHPTRVTRNTIETEGNRRKIAKRLAARRPMFAF